MLTHEGGGMSTVTFSMETLGSNRATIAGTQGAIELDPAFYTWTGFTRRHASLEKDAFVPEMQGRGMQFQAADVERCVAAGELESATMPLDETVAIMRVMDEIAAEMRVGSAD